MTLVMRIFVLVVLLLLALSNVKLTYETRRLEKRITVLEKGWTHLLRRMNALEYPEVLGRSKNRKN